MLMIVPTPCLIIAGSAAFSTWIAPSTSTRNTRSISAMSLSSAARPRATPALGVDPGAIAAEMIDRRVGEPLDLRAIGQIGGDRQGAAAGAFDVASDLVQGPFVARRNHDRRPAAAEQQGGLPANPRRGPGHHDHLLFQRYA